jgi:hypothetical protein
MLELVNNVLVSSANIIGLDLLFVIFGMSFYIKKKKQGSQNRFFWNNMFNFCPVRKGVITMIPIVY